MESFTLLESLLFSFVHEASAVLGFIGVLVILIGAMRAIFDLFVTKGMHINNVRRNLGSHTILGLDFLVGKDIIDTLLLGNESNDEFYVHLISLFAVITIRILLTYFMAKELKEIEEDEERHKRKATA